MLRHVLQLSLLFGLTASCGKEKNADPTSGSSSAPHPLIGKWYTESGNADITFRKDYTGVLHYVDLNNTPGCEDGSVTQFNWTTDDGMLALDYQSMRICGEPRSPDNDPPQPYTVSGNTLEWAGTTWYREGNSGSDNSYGGGNNGQVAFWIASDLGCGNISVSCNGVTKTIDGYYSSGSPDCGDTYAATFTLKPGTYSFTASCSSLDWDGTVTVKTGTCSKMQLTGNGGGNSGGTNGGNSGGGNNNGGNNGGNNSSNTGDVVLWAGGNLAGKSLKVEVYSYDQAGNMVSFGTRTLSSTFSNPPTCGASGAANYTLTPGVYRYGVQLGTPGTADYQWWEDGFTVKKGACVKARIY